MSLGLKPNDFLRSVADQIPTESKVLCLAEGEGRNAVFLAQQGQQKSNPLSSMHRHEKRHQAVFFSSSLSSSSGLTGLP